MLKMVVNTISSVNKSATVSTFKILEPICTKTPTKTMWQNFEKQLELMNRDPHHVLSYFLAELGTDGVIGNNGEMILTGGYMPRSFNKIIRKYATDYVQCIDCKKYDTEFKHMKKERLDYIICKSCGASRTVESIGMRFVATKRGQRRKERQ